MGRTKDNRVSSMPRHGVKTPPFGILQAKVKVFWLVGSGKVRYLLACQIR